jgi:hypothetical protein
MLLCLSTERSACILAIGELRLVHMVHTDLYLKSNGEMIWRKTDKVHMDRLDRNRAAAMLVN